MFAMSNYGGSPCTKTINFYHFFFNEAINFGLPLIVSDIPPHREQLDNEHLIYRIGDLDDLRRKIINVSDNYDYYKNNIKNFTNYNIEGFIDDFNKEKRNLCEVAITEREMNKAKNRYYIGYFDTLRSNSGLATLLGEQEVVFKDYTHYEEELAMYKSITIKEVKDLCRKMMLTEKENVFAIGDKFL